MHYSMRRRVFAGTVTVLLTAAAAATGAHPFAEDVGPAPTAPATCQAPAVLPSPDGGTVTFGLLHPVAE